MILSTSHNFIFVHVPKTAGTAMTAALCPFGVHDTRTLGRRLLRRFPIPEAAERAYFRKHETALDMRNKMGAAAFSQFLKFTVVRNPFDHAVSHYEYLKEFRNPKKAQEFAAMSFSEYLHWRTKKRGLFVPFFSILPSQAHFVADETGENLLVDSVLKFENLADDFYALTQDLGLSNVKMQRINPTKAKQKGRSFASYYDDKTVAVVQKLYENDFDLFGYDRNLPSP